MKIRFGYVAMSVILENASPSGTVTFKTYSALAEKDPAAALGKLRRTARTNLGNTLRLLRHNKAHGIGLYRFSSKIIPLATHPLLSDWNYLFDLDHELKAIGDYVRINGMRVSFHPDHYTLINSPREEVLLSSLSDMEHHCLVLKAMGLDKKAKLVTHIGGGYKNKDKSLARFLKNWERVPGHVAGRLTLENDDKTFTAGEVLYLCRRLSLPMVLDLHHLKCNAGDDREAEIISPVFDTWRDTGHPPKIHISSPRSETDSRSHHDFVNPDDLYPFLKLAREINTGFDVMVEAKQKDRAMFRLVKELASYPMIKQTGEAALKFE